MSKLKIILRILLGLVVLIATATVEVLLRPKSEQQKQMERDFEKMNKTVRQIEQMNKNGAAFFKNTDMTALLEATRAKKKIPDYKFIDEIYSDLLDSLKKSSSANMFFIEQKKGLELKLKLKNYIDQINEKYPASKIKQEGILDLGNLNSHGKIISWEVFYFGSLKKNAIIQNLRKIKIKLVENDIERMKTRNASDNIPQKQLK